MVWFSCGFEDVFDYSWCRWDDNRLRSYLEEKGVIKTKQQATRDQLLAKMKESYTSATDPVWQAWSDSYIVGISCCFGFLTLISLSRKAG